MISANEARRNSEVQPFDILKEIQILGIEEIPYGEPQYCNVWYDREYVIGMS